MRQAPLPKTAPDGRSCGPTARRRLAFLVVALAATFAPFATRASAQDTSLEEFETVDPYTKGQPELMSALGVRSFGPFLWAGSQNTLDVRSALGGISVIFIETEHFKLASTLSSYKPGSDRQDKRWLEEDLAAFKKRLPKFKAPSKIDPWLRAHLWAQRLEAQYADFSKRFSLSREDFAEPEASAARGQPMGEGPYFGQKNKFTVLLTQQRSAFGRYLMKYTGLENEYAYRYKFEDSYFYGANFEALADSERGFESSLAASVAASVAVNFVEGFRDSNRSAPEWFTLGLAHVYAREVDPRWNQWGAGGDATSDDDKSVEWAPRVFGLVKNEAATSWEEMLGWSHPDQIKARDHMLAWSRVEWILEERADKARDLLMAFTKPIPFDKGDRDALRRAQGERAQRDVLGADSAELDSQWREWVLDTYPKRR